MRWLALAAATLAASGAAACEDARIDVATHGTADVSRDQLRAAVAELRGAGHSPEAFQVFTQRVLALRPGTDETVAEEAELYLVTEALPALRAAALRHVPATTLALTVWPLGLAPPISAPVPGLPAADAWSNWMPRAGETAGAYLERLCGGALALECKDVVPEGQAPVVEAVVIERYTRRERNAVSTCLTCVEPHWAQAVAGWEELDRAAAATVIAARAAGSPRRWPVAGDGAVELPPADGGVRHVHLEPTARAERVGYALADARRAGVARVALVAREAAYPYRLRAYVLPASLTRLPVRDGEPVQMLIQALDAARRRARPSPGAASGDRRR